jgi:tetratricopeptide (TPR) repeat protein
MKYYLRSLLATLLICLPFVNFAQSRADIIKEVQKLMTENYIFIDTAEATNEHLTHLMEIDFFKSIDDPQTFAKMLTTEMQKITHDKHLNIAPPRQQRAAAPTTDFITRHLNNLERFRNGGFGKIELLEGNIGYVSLEGFRREDIPKVDAVMNYFSTADAMIIDLRENGGGNSLGQYWSSYFLEDNIAVSGLYERRTDNYSELKTVAVKGKKRLNIPLFILTSHFTFSAAEAFAYDLQCRNRAFVIGETTGGGAHPVEFMALPEGYSVIMPYARSINPISKTNWEGIGVQPNLLTASDRTFETAKLRAREAAKMYREGPFLNLKDILLKDQISQTAAVEVERIITLLIARNHLEDFMVVDLGYFYLDNDQINATLAIFKANTNIFPESPNAHDSYAESLAKHGQNDDALKHFKKAVSLAEAQKDHDVNSFRKNLVAFKASLNQ